MVFFNWATMQMAAKIVYYGPGLCGKTSNLSYIYAKTSPDSRGEMVSLETESDRTLFFDLLPIEVGTIGGFKTRLQLYTVPGQVFYNTTRKLVLKGVDGLVFVADSQRPMRDANIESFNSLVDNLNEFALELSELPIVLQYNKRDLKNILSIEELNSDLNPNGDYPFHEASAVNGDGVITTLKAITKLTLKKLRARMTATETGAQPGQIGTPPVRQIKAPQPAPISAESLARAAEEGVGSEAAQQAAVVESTPEHETVTPPSAGVTESQPTTADEAPAAPAHEERPPVAADSSPEQAAAPETDATSSPEAVSTAGDGPATLDEGDKEPTPVIEVDFDTDGESEETEQPQVKRVQVSNQMDILAELDGLRKQATMASNGRSYQASAPDLDLDSLLSGDSGQSLELRSNIEKSVNSDVFANMRGLQVAIRIQNESGDTIHSIEPVSLDIEDAAALKKLCLRFSLDLENIR
jgi:signal recognition particle receptor subunit beta